MTLLFQSSIRIIYTCVLGYMYGICIQSTVFKVLFRRRRSLCCARVSSFLVNEWNIYSLTSIYPISSGLMFYLPIPHSHTHIPFQIRRRNRYRRVYEGNKHSKGPFYVDALFSSLLCSAMPVMCVMTRRLVIDPAWAPLNGAYDVRIVLRRRRPADSATNTNSYSTYSVILLPYIILF